MKTTKIKTYTEAVQRGDYELYEGNLSGKYDNVRTYWEDQLTRFVLRPFLSKIVSDKQATKKRSRILDMGCGAGQGYELITKIDKHDIDLRLHHDRVLPEDDIEVFLGMDLNEAMVEKGNETFKDKPNIKFILGDLRDGLGAVRDEQPFDIYFSSYASLSHLKRHDLLNLLVDICNHGNNDSLIFMDFLGRYSIEWPNYWDAKTEEEKIRDYSMSYLYNGNGQDAEVEHFPVRYWTGAEVEDLVRELVMETKIHVDILAKSDRSILVGRTPIQENITPNSPPSGEL